MKGAVGLDVRRDGFHAEGWWFDPHVDVFKTTCSTKAVKIRPENKSKCEWELWCNGTGDGW